MLESTQIAVSAASIVGFLREAHSISIRDDKKAAVRSLLSEFGIQAVLAQSERSDTQKRFLWLVAWISLDLFALIKPETTVPMSTTVKQTTKYVDLIVDFIRQVMEKLPPNELKPSANHEIVHASLEQVRKGVANSDINLLFDGLLKLYEMEP